MPKKFKVNIISCILYNRCHTVINNGTHIKSMYKELKAVDALGDILLIGSIDNGRNQKSVLI